ncbi:hypothetical protein NPIL_151811 [Nephila pilipes]|uniref:Uncharacterized protein n=1 Tax=Nephila pilipes TaxID=299642 RepID=A0A8X6P5P3_NEPPI|nr:hypothetical protein NPIL_151811 [Nephila pilipes]
MANGNGPHNSKLRSSNNGQNTKRQTFISFGGNSVGYIAKRENPHRNFKMATLETKACFCFQRGTSTTDSVHEKLASTYLSDITTALPNDSRNAMKSLQDILRICFFVRENEPKICHRQA